MLAFAGQRLSAHMVRKSNGTLVCIGVPLCRTGIQEYKKSEVTGEPSDELVEVVRSAAEVLNPTSIASYEGVPVCDTHPPMFLTPQNWSAFARGHIQNCRVDTLPSGEKCIVGDLVIEDELLIQKILTGTRDLSAGYSCLYEPLPNGRWKQSTIRCNHVAVVASGRANQGRRDEVRIYDSVDAIAAADDFGQMMKRYHRQPVLSVEPAPQVRTHRAPREHIEGKVADMGDKKMTPELLIAKIRQIHNSVPRMLGDELDEIQSGADEVTVLSMSGIGPGQFAERLRQVNASYRAFDDTAKAGREFEESSRAAGRKMQEKMLEPFRACTDKAIPVHEHAAEDFVAAANRVGRRMRGR